MLEEIREVSQKEKGVFRRWFEDDFFALIVWYDRHHIISGFQLCYDILDDEHAFTWQRTHGFSHNRIDSHREALHYPSSPILVANGIFPFDRILDEFKKRSTGLDHDLTSTVIEKITEFAASQGYTP